VSGLYPCIATASSETEFENRRKKRKESKWRIRGGMRYENGIKLLQQ
jgi:hypothetical protein